MINTEAVKVYAYHAQNYEGKYLLPEQKTAALNFGTKVEYLHWVGEWKAAYKILSTQIRAAKRNRKESSPTYDWQAAAKARDGKHLANCLLFARREAKVRSRELRAIRLEVEKQRAS